MHGSLEPPVTDHCLVNYQLPQTVEFGLAVGNNSIPQYLHLVHRVFLHSKVFVLFVFRVVIWQVG